jgi:hypothetical protein
MKISAGLQDPKNQCAVLVGLLHLGVDVVICIAHTHQPCDITPAAVWNIIKKILTKIIIILQQHNDIFKHVDIFSAWAKLCLVIFVIIARILQHNWCGSMFFQQYTAQLRNS